MPKSIFFVIACVLVGVAAWLVLAKPSATSSIAVAPRADETEAAKAASRAMTFTRPAEPQK